jgi:transketolase N-terminal domain/subunit
MAELHVGIKSMMHDRTTNMEPKTFDGLKRNFRGFACGDNIQMRDTLGIGYASCLRYTLQVLVWHRDERFVISRTHSWMLLG